MLPHVIPSTFELPPHASQDTAFHALSLLVVFLPTPELYRAPGAAPWDDWIRDWLALCREIPICHYWTARWAELLWRTLRDDRKNSIDWETHGADICGLFLHAYNMASRAG